MSNSKVPRAIVHDDPDPVPPRPRAPSLPGSASAFDRLVESNLELSAEVRALADQVRQLVQVLTKAGGR